MCRPSGGAAAGSADPSQDILDAFLDEFGRAVAAGHGLEHAVAAGLEAAAPRIAAELERWAEEDRAAGPATSPASPAVVTELDPMLDGREGEPAASAPRETPRDPIDARRFARYVAAEIGSGCSREDARRNALATMGERDAAAAGIDLQARPAMDAAAFLAHVRRLAYALSSADGSSGKGRREAA